MKRRLTLLLVLLLGVDLLVAVPVAATHGGENSEAVDCNKDVPVLGYTDRTVAEGGTSGNDRILGTGGPDVMDGVEGDDILCGFGGNDKLDGGAGNDRLYGGDGRDNMSGHSGDDHLSGGDGPDRLEGLQDDDYIDGGEGQDELDYSCTASGITFCNTWTADGQNVDLAAGSSTGGQGNDEFTSVEIVKGSPGTDTLLGRAGEVDEFLPTSGNDTIDGRGDDDNDVLYYYLFDGETPPAEGEYLVYVNLPANEVTHPDGIDVVSSIETVYGTAHADRLAGGDRREQLNGMGGDDLIEGNGGNDRLDGGDGEDTILGGDGHDHLLGRFHNDTLDGGAGNDFLEGEEGHDIIDGGAGDFDVLDYRCASTGNDANELPLFCSTLGADDGQIVNLGTFSSTGGQGTDTFENVEALRGSAHDDTLTGTGGSDYIWPGRGDDTVNGLGGQDYVDYTRWEDDPNGDCDTTGTDSLGVTIHLGTGEVEQRTSGLTYTDNLTGIEHATGSAMNDTIIGSGGANSLWGGCGNDVVKGAGGNDVLEGGLGDDALYGNAGRDIVSYDGYEPASGSRGVRVHLGAGTALAEGSDSLFTIETVIGSEYDDVLTGSRGRDLLMGGAGADQLWGREGADVLIGNGLPFVDGGPADGADGLYGGPGRDTADFSRADGPVDVDLADQFATGDGSRDHLESVEAVKGTDFKDVLRGDAGANFLYGGKGNDTLVGRQGDDYLDGQQGADTANGGAGTFDIVDYSFTASAVTVNLAKGVGSAVEDGVKRTEQWQDVEVVAGTSGNDVMRGNGARNYLAGEAGKDKIYGRDGPDFLHGGKGVDDLRGGAGRDVCHDPAAETICETTRKGRPGWHRDLGNLRSFRTTGDDQYLSALDEVIEELRRLHRRRLHRRRLHR